MDNNQTPVQTRKQSPLANMGKVPLNQAISLLSQGQTPQQTAKVAFETQFSGHGPGPTPAGN